MNALSPWRRAVRRKCEEGKGETMGYRGHVENGAVVLDEPAEIPEGARVSVAVLCESQDESTEDHPKTLYDRLKHLIGKAEGLPSDLAENHDHYLHGRPKK